MKKTQTGRVVYYRELHVFSGKDLVRIMKAIAKNEDWRVLSTTIADMIAEFLHSYTPTIKNSIYLQLLIVKIVAEYYKLTAKDIMDFMKNIHNNISLGKEEEIDVYFT